MTNTEWTVEEAASGERLDKFLAAAARVGSRGRAADALARGRVFVNDQEATPADAARRLVAGDRVRFWPDRPGSARKKTPRAARPGELPIVFEDDALIVVNKPPGLLAVPLERQEDATSVQDELMLHLRSQGKRRPLVVHRIDRDTSGLVVFATRPDAQARLKDQFRRREPERVYLAVVYGHPTPVSGSWNDYLVWDHKQLIQKETHPRDPKAQEARSQYRVVEKLRAGIEIARPEPVDQDYIHEKYMNELVPGKFLPETRAGLLAIIDRVKSKTAIDGVILAGTELPLILREPSHDGLPLLNTTKIHCQAAVEEMLS